MANIKELKVFEENKVKWIFVDDFLHVLRKYLKPTDRLKEIRKDNVMTFFKPFSEAVAVKQDKTAIHFILALKYIFAQYEKLEACKILARQVESCILKEPQPENQDRSTVFSLYTEISKRKIKQLSTRNTVGYECNLSQNEIPTLYIDHKERFSEAWYNICRFESHVSRYHYKNICDMSYDDQLREKWKVYDNLLAWQDICKDIPVVAKKVIANRAHRHKCTKEMAGIHIQCAQIHKPVVIDRTVETELQSMFLDKVENVISIDSCLSESKNCITLCIELSASDTNNESLQQITNRACAFAKRKHLVLLEKVIFLKPGTTSSYMTEGVVARFALRDDILARKIGANIIMTSFPSDGDDIFNDGDTEERKHCETCFSCIMPQPLQLVDFDVLNEWHFDVPLETQIFLEMFINKNTLLRTEDRNEIMKKKLTRLYALYDNILSTCNYKHFGIHQEANTDEISLQYRSLRTVFAVTANSGTTTSISTAERRLKERSQDDLCYYNTYLKKYDLSYESDAGLIEGGVSLRNCILIAMWDNLLRLSYHKDPVPGQCRSHQICTLPITIQGIPEDSKVTESWHNPTLCNGSVDCDCKKSIAHTPDDVILILTLTQSEKDVLSRFNQLCTWRNMSVWKDMKFLLETEIKDQHPDSDNDDTPGFQMEHERQTSTFNLIEDDQPDCSDHYTSVLPAQEPMQLPASPIATETADVNSYKRVMSLDTFNYSNDAEERWPESLNSAVIEETEENELEDLHSILRDAIAGDCDWNLESCIPLIDDSIETLDADLSEMEISMSQLTVEEAESNNSQENILPSFGFEKYKVPNLLTRHPPPAIGRDDDINKMQEILDDILVKSGTCESPRHCEQNHEPTKKIMCGVDQKIGGNLLKLIKKGGRNQHFIPEFPLLHLRKSKITILFSSYKDAGLIDLLRFMKNDEEEDWSKLVSIQHIDTATRNIKRLSMAFHSALIARFVTSLDEVSAREIESELMTFSASQLSQKWGTKVDAFITNTAKVNATFALHVNMMHHCDEIVALSLAERLGGETGYTLVLATVKQSLPFSFINGATSYAPYSTNLVNAHLSCGSFYKGMKECLFSTPIGNSSCNFACDTKREMDHQDVTKCFRSGSSISGIKSRMSLIDPFKEVHESFVKVTEKGTDDLGFKISSNDQKYVLPTAEIILQRGLVTTPDNFPHNVYGKTPVTLPMEILDTYSLPAGEYLLKKYIADNGLFQCTETDLPDLNEVAVPKPLIARLKKCTGVTMKRCTNKSTKPAFSKSTGEEVKRKKTVDKETKQLDRFSSKMNACQAVVKPDGSKPKVQKARGVPKALKSLMNHCVTGLECPSDVSDMMIVKTETIPSNIVQNVKFTTVEFAGIKFKAYVESGDGYMEFVQKKVFDFIHKKLPNTKHICISEEKYQFTPDVLKAQTRSKRKGGAKTSISHLKPVTEILGAKKYDREAILTTAEGKSAISIYLAKHVDEMNITWPVIVDVDSELHIEGCNCKDPSLKCNAKCQKYSIPIRCNFGDDKKITKLANICQRKGEAEMAQIDWLFEILPLLQKGEAVLSLVTSGDIDAIPLHMYAISRSWPRNDNKFLHSVYVILQKPKGKMDIYNVTAIISLIEDKFAEDRYIAMKVAIILSMAGNDFLPKYASISYDKMLMAFVSNSEFRENLFNIDSLDIAEINDDKYVTFIKHLFTPRKLLATEPDFEIVRLHTIKSGISKTGEVTSAVKNSKNWLPPESVLKRIVRLINLFIIYLKGVGKHEAVLPNFLENSCLVESDGEIVYDFGQDAKEDIDHLLQRCKTMKSKRKLDETPQKGERKKIPFVATSTPKQTRI